MTALLTLSFAGCSTTATPRAEPGDARTFPTDLRADDRAAGDSAAQADAARLGGGDRTRWDSASQSDATLASVTTDDADRMSAGDSRWAVQRSRADATTVDDPWELTLGGSGASNDDFDTGAANLAVSVGYYFSEVVELSLRQGLSYGDPGENASGRWNGISRLALDFHLPLECWSPFIGANFGYIYGDTTNESWMAGVEGGVKWYVKDQTFVQAIIEYDFIFDESDRVEDLFEDAAFIYGLGMGIRF